MITDIFPTYSVLSSSISNSGNVEIVAINNNSNSSVFITSIRGKKYVSGTTTFTSFILEGYRCSASSTGGTDISNSVQRADTNTPELDSSIKIITRGTTTTSGAPLFGLSYEIGTPFTSQNTAMYEYRNTGMTKVLRLAPGEIFVVAKAPGTAVISAAYAGAMVEFVVTPSSYVDETVEIENTTRDTYAFNTSGFTVSGSTNSVAISNESAKGIVRLNVIRYRHTPSGSGTSKPFTVEAFLCTMNPTAAGPTIELTTRVSKFDTNSPDLPSTIRLWYNPSYGATVPTSAYPIMGGTFNSDASTTQITQDLYSYRGGLGTKQYTIRGGQALVLSFAPGTLAIGQTGVPASGGYYIEFTYDPGE